MRSLPAADSTTALAILRKQAEIQDHPMAANPFDNAARLLDDRAHHAQPAVSGQLAWVGMGEIEAPVRLPLTEAEVSSVARVTAAVNLIRPEARGIHMSRLYLQVERMLGNEPLSPCSLRRLLREFLDSHAELSDRARLGLRFELLLQRPALVSDHHGWRAYPVQVQAQMVRGQFSLELGVEVLYSSTCPCSAALSRQLIQDQFRADFGNRPLDADAVLAWLGSEQGVLATPHSQRSSAELRVRLQPSFAQLPIVDLIDAAEAALATPVQTAVKREDEQAFARLNGGNLMFCEDAARRLQSALNRDDRIADFWLRATHFESLHPHNAVAVAVKGVEGGYEDVGCNGG